jgi:hypothetical protein
LQTFHNHVPHNLSQARSARNWLNGLINGHGWLDGKNPGRSSEFDEFDLTDSSRLTRGRGVRFAYLGMVARVIDTVVFSDHGMTRMGERRTHDEGNLERHRGILESFSVLSSPF